MIKNKKHFIAMNAIYAIILVVVIVLNLVAGYWGEALIQVFGYTNGRTGGNVTAAGDNLYYVSAYTDEELRAAQHDLAHRIASEGTVLLTNENNALPLDEGADSLSVIIVLQ